MWTLLLMLLWSNLISASQILMPQELYMNRLNMSFNALAQYRLAMDHITESFMITNFMVPQGVAQVLQL